MLRQMVQINSFTANPQGVNQLGDLTAEMFAELGFSAERIQATNFLFGKHLILTRNGRGSPAHKAVPTIGLISHLDTVYPMAEELENDFEWRVSGERIYGPGTFDIKGGTIMIYMVLDAMRAISPEYFDSVNWVILLNAAEESLVADFGQICRERLVENSLAALVFEGGELNGGLKSQKLVVARKGMARYRIEVEGKAAHAGTAHAQGANAILQMAEVIQRVASFTNYQDAITFNVGTIAGGTVINRVPHRASAFVEMRAFSPVIFADGLQKMTALNEFCSVRSASDGYPCHVDVAVLGEWDPWASNAGSVKLLALWQEVGTELGIAIEAEERGGLSDGNWMWQQVPTIDGLGPVGGNAHCSQRSEDGSKDQEYILPETFVPKALLNVRAMRRLIMDYYND